MKAKSYKYHVFFLPIFYFGWHFDNDIFLDASQFFISYSYQFSLPISTDALLVNNQKACDFSEENFCNMIIWIVTVGLCVLATQRIRLGVMWLFYSLVCLHSQHPEHQYERLTDTSHNLWLYPFHQFQLLPSVKLSYLVMIVHQFHRHRHFLQSSIHCVGVLLPFFSPTVLVWIQIWSIKLECLSCIWIYFIIFHFRSYEPSLPHFSSVRFVHLPWNRWVNLFKRIKNKQNIRKMRFCYIKF